jgi:hypothetical protein
VAYWTSDHLRSVFDNAVLLEEIASPRQGCATSDNGRFLRHWHEVHCKDLGLRIPSREEAIQTGIRWFPYNKGGAFRKWSGNADHVVNWHDDGAEIKAAVAAKYPYLNGNVDYVVKNRDFYFLESVSWSKVTSGGFALRHFEPGFVFDVSGCSIFPDRHEHLYLLLGSMNSPVMGGALNSLSPTLNFEVGQVASFPIAESLKTRKDFIPTVKRLISLARADWNAYERSWDFQSLPLLRGQGLGARGEEGNSSLILHPSTLEQSYKTWIEKNSDTITEMKRLEEENNRLFIDAYSLQDELTPDVPIAQITLTVNPAYRYGQKGARDEGLGEREDALGIAAELWERFRQDTMKELVSYAIGCMMGRYRLDVPGLIYAHSGNERFWEIYEGGRRDEGRGGSEELSRSDCVAEGDGTCGESLSNDQGLSSGREIRAGESDPESGSIDSLEHSGGTCASEQGGVSKLSIYRTGFESRIGDPDVDRHSSGLCHETTGRNDPQSARRAIQNAERYQEETNPLSLTPHPLFRPDDDGIVPLTDTEWFDDDAAHRLIEFISVAWPAEHLEDNITFLAENLSPKKNESSRETLRRYLNDKFFKDHLQSYKKRPIYWLFSSGKQKAFQCLVYLHRYNEGALSRMRSEYVIPLQGTMSARLEQLQGDIQAATSTSHRKRLEKEHEKLVKQQVELLAFDEKLRHYADMRISLDLDDGVKVNYGKFGDLLAEVKAVHGKKPEGL